MQPISGEQNVLWGLFKEKVDRLLWEFFSFNLFERTTNRRDVHFNISHIFHITDPLSMNTILFSFVYQLRPGTIYFPSFYSLIRFFSAQSSKASKLRQFSTDIWLATVALSSVDEYGWPWKYCWNVDTLASVRHINRVALAGRNAIHMVSGKSC